MLIPTGRGLKDDAVDLQLMSTVLKKANDLKLSFDFKKYSSERINVLKKNHIALRCGMGSSETTESKASLQFEFDSSNFCSKIVHGF